VNRPLLLVDDVVAGAMTGRAAPWCVDPLACGPRLEDVVAGAMAGGAAPRCVDPLACGPRVEDVVAGAIVVGPWFSGD
jgi:hypothetical protein